MRATKYRNLITGAAVGFVAGLIVWAAVLASGISSITFGLLGVPLTGVWIVLHLLLSVLAGAGFGAVSRYEPQGYASTISSGLLYGMLWWVAGPLTIGVYIQGGSPTWSIDQAGLAFPSLIGHLFYGGILGFGFYALEALLSQLISEPEPEVTEGEKSSTRVVILGGGFGGTTAAQRLEHVFARDVSVEVTLVSHSNFLLFTPMLAGVATSSLEDRHITAPVRAACPNTRFRKADVEEIDTVNKVIKVRSSASSQQGILPYDHLVLALGSVPNYYGLPGLEENSFCLKSIEDATRFRDHVISLLELADSETDEEEKRRQLTFVVTGGGFAGTETVAELFDLVHSVLRYYPNISRSDIRFVLVHSRDRILPELSPKLGDYALDKLRNRGIEFALGARVSGATHDSVLLGDSPSIDTRTIVWTAGNQPNPILGALPCEKNRAGAVTVDNTLQVNGLENVWAVGDCAQIPDPDNEGQFYPPTAQHATREGKTVADNIAAVINGEEPKAFRFRAIGLLVNLGRNTGAAEILGLRFSGLLAWFLWRTIYLSKLPSMEKRVRVMLDWSLDLLFPRDIVLTSRSEVLSHGHMDDVTRMEDPPSSTPTRPVKEQAE